MKVLNKYFKVVLCFIAFALCSFMFAFTPTYTAVHAAEITIAQYKNAISTLKMPTETVDYGSTDPKVNAFRIPLLTTQNVDGANYTIRVMDKSGYAHDYVVGANAENNSNFFGEVFTADSSEEHVKAGLIAGNKYLTVKAKNGGEYKVLYIIKDENNKKEYYSNVYTVNVESVSFELDFSSPKTKETDGVYSIVGYTKNLTKTTMAKSSTPYELPVAYAKVKGSELDINKTTGIVENDSSLNNEVSIKVTKDGAAQVLNESGSLFTSNDGKFYITPSSTGVYTVEYSYNNSENCPTETLKIVVKDNFTASDLTLATNPTINSSSNPFALGATVKLPSLTVNAGEEKNVDVNVESVVIEKVGSNGTIKHTLRDNNLEFVMSKENFGAESYEDMVGSYTVKYTVKGAYENQTLTETFEVQNVTVLANPTVKLSYNYNAANYNPANEDFTKTVKFGAETEIQAEYTSEKEVGFVLPAVYFEDVVTTDFEDFDVVRAIRKGNTRYYIDNVRYDDNENKLVDILPTDNSYNASGDTNIGDPSKAVLFKFNADATNIEGTYYLEYTVISNVVKERKTSVYVEGTNNEYSFKVVAPTALKDYQKPSTVQITNLKNSLVKKSDKFVVNVKATDDIDIRLKKAVFTYSTAKTAADGKTFEYYLEQITSNLVAALGTNKESHVLDNDKLINGWGEQNGLSHYFNDVTRLTESSKDNFDLDLSNSEDVINVVAVAFNDGELIKTDSKQLEIKNTDDADAPAINVYTERLPDIWKKVEQDSTLLVYDFEVGQGETVELPSVYVDDGVNGDKSLSLDVYYYIENPNNDFGGIDFKSPTGKDFTWEKVSDKDVQVIKGGSIKTSEVGTYFVAYTATDVAGNTTIKYFTFEVVDTSTPILTVNPVTDDENVEIVGNTVTGEAGTVIDFEVALKSADGLKDYTSNENIKVAVSDNGKGLNYRPSGNSRTSYVFNDYGTYTVTVTGSYKTTVNNEEQTIPADSKVFNIVIKKQAIKWLGEFDVPEYAVQGQEVRLPDIAANNGAVVKVTYVAPNNSTDEAVNAEKKIDVNGYTYWSFTPSSNKGTYKVIYTATTNDDVLTKELNIKVGDNVAPELTFNAGELTQNYIYDGEHDIEVVLEVNKKYNNESFVVKVINNGKEVISHDIDLKITDKEDSLNSSPRELYWTKLKYEITGTNVTKGETKTEGKLETTQYLIKGVGSYKLKFTMTDDYDNVNDKEYIEFKVVAKAAAKEKNDTVVGAVLIVISLVLLAGVILFFTLTSKKGNKTTKKEKVVKAKETKSVENKTEEKEEVETEEVVEEKEEVKTEETVETESETATEEVVEEKVDEEPKSGDVE